MFDSIGIFLLTLIVAGAVVVLWRPQWFALVAGLLLVASLATNAAAICNHPALLESLKQMGHHVNSMPRAQGDAHSIQWQEGTRRYQGVADRRRDGWAAGD